MKIWSSSCTSYFTTATSTRTPVLASSTPASSRCFCYLSSFSFSSCTRCTSSTRWFSFSSCTRWFSYCSCNMWSSCSSCTRFFSCSSCTRCSSLTRCSSCTRCSSYSSFFSSTYCICFSCSSFFISSYSGSSCSIFICTRCSRYSSFIVVLVVFDFQSLDSQSAATATLGQATRESATLVPAVSSSITPIAPVKISSRSVLSTKSVRKAEKSKVFGEHFSSNFTPFLSTKRP